MPGVAVLRMTCPPQSNKFGRVYHTHPSTFGRRIIGDIARDKIVGRSRQRDVKKWLVISIWQIQRCIGGGNRQTIHLKFDQHFPNANRVKFETRPGQNLRGTRQGCACHGRFGWLLSTQGSESRRDFPCCSINPTRQRWCRAQLSLPKMSLTGGLDFGVNIVHGQTGSAIGLGGLLQGNLRLHRAHAAKRGKGGFQALRINGQ